jgi:hypothetical protein
MAKELPLYDLTRGYDSRSSPQREALSVAMYYEHYLKGCRTADEDEG